MAAALPMLMSLGSSEGGSNLLTIFLVLCCGCYCIGGILYGVYYYMFLKSASAAITNLLHTKPVCKNGGTLEGAICYKNSSWGQWNCANGVNPDSLSNKIITQSLMTGTSNCAYYSKAQCCDCGSMKKVLGQCWDGAWFKGMSGCARGCCLPGVVQCKREGPICEKGWLFDGSRCTQIPTYTSSTSASTAYTSASKFA